MSSRKSSTAVRISSSVLRMPMLKRTALCACASLFPMAFRTCDGCTEPAEQALPDFYDLFCEGFEAAECAAAENAARHSESGQILGAALRAQAEQRMALRLLEAED